MHQLILTINRDQANALVKSMNVFARLCRRDMRVLTELVEADFIPVFDSNSTWRSRPATPEVVVEFEAMAKAIESVIGPVLPGTGELTGVGRAAEAFARRLTTSLEATPASSIAVESSLEEAQAAAESLDVYVRLGIGQIMIVDEMVRLGAVRMSGGEGEAGLGDIKLLRRCEGLFERLRVALNFSVGQSLGVGNRSVSLEAHRAWEVCKVIRQALAFHRDPNPEFRGVHYDGLDLLRYTHDPRPIAVVAERTP